MRAAFDRVLAAVSGFGPVEVLAEKTRIALHVWMSFAAFMPCGTGWAATSCWPGTSSAPLPAGRGIFPRNVVHTFRLSGTHDVDACSPPGWERLTGAVQQHRRGGAAGR